jgi:hypothetical protein
MLRAILGSQNVWHGQPVWHAGLKVSDHCRFGSGRVLVCGDLAGSPLIAYHAVMEKERPAPPELEGLRWFLGRLESGELQLSQFGADVTQDEISVLKREIAHLETALARVAGTP